MARERSHEPQAAMMGGRAESVDTSAAGSRPGGRARKIGPAGTDYVMYSFPVEKLPSHGEVALELKQINN